MREFVVFFILLGAVMHFITYYPDPNGPREFPIYNDPPIDVNITASRGNKSPILPKYSKREFLNALWQVESSGRYIAPDGDNGSSIGPYQISEPYYLDSVAYSKSTTGQYQDCRVKEFAEVVIQNYMLRYCPEAWNAKDWETVARIHNGGPRGVHKNATRPYWEKVKRVLEGEAN